MDHRDLRAWRERHKLSQTEAAKYFGVQQESFSRWETDARPMLPMAEVLLHLYQFDGNVKSVHDFLYPTLDT